MTELTVWDRMEELLDRSGFRQYRVDDDRAVVMTPDTGNESGAGGMSILELVRGAPTPMERQQALLKWQYFREQLRRLENV